MSKRMTIPVGISRFVLRTIHAGSYCSRNFLQRRGGAWSGEKNHPRELRSQQVREEGVQGDRFRGCCLRRDGRGHAESRQGGSCLFQTKGTGVEKTDAPQL